MRDGWVLIVVAILAGIIGAGVVMFGGRFFLDDAPPAAAPNAGLSWDDAERLIDTRLAEEMSAMASEGTGSDVSDRNIRALSDRISALEISLQEAGDDNAALQEELVELRTQLAAILGVPEEVVSNGWPRAQTRPNNRRDVEEVIENADHAFEELDRLLAEEQARDQRNRLTAENAVVRNVAVGSSTESYLDESDATVTSNDNRNGAYAEAFTFVATEDVSYEILVQSYEVGFQDQEQFDTYIALDDPTGQQIATNDDGGGSVNSRIEFTAAMTGTYRVLVTSFSRGATGRFRFTVREYDPDLATESIPGVSLEGTWAASAPVGGDTTGVLTENDGWLLWGIGGTRLHADEFVFAAMSGRRYRIDLISDTFDEFLVLFDPTGNAIRQDNSADSGSQRASITFRAAESGGYRLAVATLNNALGAYELTITPLDG